MTEVDKAVTEALARRVQGELDLERARRDVAAHGYRVFPTHPRASGLWTLFMAIVGGALVAAAVVINVMF